MCFNQDTGNLKELGKQTLFFFFCIFCSVEIRKAYLAGTDSMSAYLLKSVNFKRLLVTNVHLWDESLLV